MCVYAGKITTISYAVNQLRSLHFDFENVILGRSVGCEKPARACRPRWSVGMSLGYHPHLWRFWLWVSGFCLDGSTAGR